MVATPSTHPPREPRGASKLDRAAAILEVAAVFALTHLAIRSFKHFTAPGRWESARGLNFSTGLFMILITAGLLLLTRRSFKEYGFAVKQWRRHLGAGAFWGCFLALTAGAAVAVGVLQLDPLHPPDGRRAWISLAGMILITLLLLHGPGSPIRFSGRNSPWIGLALLLVLLAFPALAALWSHQPAGPALAAALWLFFGAGLGEEVFFRGYIQTRIDQAFGCPLRIQGVDLGLGVVVSTLLFGFIHALNTVDYFEGRYQFAWWWMLANSGTGLFYGVLRAKTGSVLPGAIAHGLADVVSRVLVIFSR